MSVLFLLPYAGGSSLIYDTWSVEGMSIKRVDYSGHGARFKSALPSSVHDVIEDLVSIIANGTCDYQEEYYLFGHSMGGLVIWLTTQLLHERGLRTPERLFISACEPPNKLNVEKYKKYKDKRILVERLIEYGRVNEKRAASKAFREIFLPIIYNDYKILSEYKYIESGSIHSCPMTVFYSATDSMMRSEMMPFWNDLSMGVEMIETGGDHFYLEDKSTANLICRTIYEDSIL